LKIKKKISK